MGGQPLEASGRKAMDRIRDRTKQWPCNLNIY